MSCPCHERRASDDELVSFSMLVPPPPRAIALTTRAPPLIIAWQAGWMEAGEPRTYAIRGRGGERAPFDWPRARRGNGPRTSLIRFCAPPPGRMEAGERRLGWGRRASAARLAKGKEGPRERCTSLVSFCVPPAPSPSVALTTRRPHCTQEQSRLRRRRRASGGRGWGETREHRATSRG